MIVRKMILNATQSTLFNLVEYGLMIMRNCFNEVKDFWSALNRWWNRRSSVLATTYSITDTDISFGILSSEKYVLNLNFILVLAKNYIHDCKMTSQNITFLSFLVLLRQELSFEEQICIKNQREQDFIEKWFWLYDQL